MQQMPPRKDSADVMTVHLVSPIVSQVTYNLHVFHVVYVATQKFVCELTYETPCLTSLWEFKAMLYGFSQGQSCQVGLTYWWWRDFLGIRVERRTCAWHAVQISQGMASGCSADVSIWTCTQLAVWGHSLSSPIDLSDHSPGSSRVFLPRL